MNQRNQYGTGNSRNRGFSTLELLLVMVVSLVIAALSIPGFNQVRRSLRISGDARDLNGAINQAKMLAAAEFTLSRVYVDLGANTANTFHIDVWNKNGIAPGVGCWQVAGDTTNPCYNPGVSPVQYLSPGVCFPVAPNCGALPAQAPPNAQPAGIGQAPRCLPVNGKRIGQVATTACITFNSRGVPIDPGTGAPTPNDAFYITDSTQSFATTVAQTGLSQVWATSVHGSGAGNWYQK